MGRPKGFISEKLGKTKHISRLCLCGCGEYTPVRRYSKPDGRSFSYLSGFWIKGHSKRGENGYNLKEYYKPRLCGCGCGKMTSKLGGRYNKFIKGHENIGRTAWNKGRPFPLESRYKMSLARLGKEPPNKIFVNADSLCRLYVKEKKNARQVSSGLGVPYNVIKNRLRSLGWSRSTKESCSTKAFKQQMRQIRIKTLTSKPFIESPNKLEKLIYNTLDKLGLSYQKQVPLFGKFVVDILFPQNNLVLEIFGRYWHELPVNVKKDFSKKNYLVRCGYRVEEIWDDEIRGLGAEPALRRVLSKYNLWPQQ